MRKLWNFITTSILISMLILIVLLFLPRLFQIQPLVVLSGSMEPNYQAGSLLYIKKVPASQIEVGDTITFKLGQHNLATHRVVSIHKKEQTFTTKGDANENADAADIPFEDLVGKPVLHIPKLGYLAKELSSVSGKIIYITVILAVIMLMFLSDMIWSESVVKTKKRRE